MPEGATIHTEKTADGGRRRYIKVKSHRSRECKAYVTEDGTGYLHPQKKWAGYYTDCFGKRRKINLSPDKAAAQSALNTLNDTIERLRAGRSVPPLDEIPPLARRSVEEALEASGQTKKTHLLSRRPISEHISAYLIHLESKGTKEKHRWEVKRCLTTIVGECGFRSLHDVGVTPVEDFTNAKMAKGASARTINGYVDQLR